MPTAHDLVCFSHLRWDFVYQRPQHLMTRFARKHRVFYFEEPTWGPHPAHLDLSTREYGVNLVVPRLPEGLNEEGSVRALRSLLDTYLEEQQIERFATWYYTPMALAFAGHLQPVATIYDCMDELSAFRFAPPALVAHEADLFRRADLVFTGGQSLYEAKRDKHRSVHAFPSSVDVDHFARARRALPEPPDQAALARPRLGFFGVLDERLDQDLLAGIADLRPDWQIVMVGPIVKIDPAELPRRANIHYLGGRRYGDLPAYLAGWDLAMMPFARNESTVFISPTKTPEYLAAGKPVVSTSIRDVVRPYGDLGLVRIADTPETFVAAAAAAMAEHSPAQVRRADEFLAQTSWERTWGAMADLIDGVITPRKTVSASLISPALGRTAGVIAP